MPPLLLIEGEYQLALRQAELDWTRRLADQIQDGTLDGLAMWMSRHRQRTRPPAPGEEAAPRSP